MFHQSRLTLKHTLALQLRRLRYGRPGPKVFCVGMQKTGTTSLQYALSLIGYRVAGVFSIRDLDAPDQMLGRALSLVPQFDAFADNPWSVLYRDLDRAVPGSKFILTTRNPEAWYGSVCQHFGSKPLRMHAWIYGVSSPVGQRDAYVSTLLRHQSEVRAYFADRPRDFLEMDVTTGDGWAQLGGLLGKRVPDRPFPRLNRREMRR